MLESFSFPCFSDEDGESYSEPEFFVNGFVGEGGGRRVPRESLGRGFLLLLVF